MPSTTFAPHVIDAVCARCPDIPRAEVERVLTMLFEEIAPALCTLGQSMATALGRLSEPAAGEALRALAGRAS